MYIILSVLSIRNCNMKTFSGNKIICDMLVSADYVNYNYYEMNML